MGGMGGIPIYNPNVPMDPEQNRVPPPGPTSNIPGASPGQNIQFAQSESAIPSPEMGLIDRLKAEGKELAVIVVLFVLLQRPEVSRMVVRYIPGTLNSMNRLNVLGNISKGVLLAIAYWVIVNWFL
jgi:hypothetical protein